jgi:nitrile hydratase subunit alpha
MSTHDHDHDHDHGHSHGPGGVEPHPFQPDTEDSAVSESQVMAQALQELLLEKGVFSADDFRRMNELLDTKNPVNGARMIARAWTDPAYRDLMLADVHKAAAALDIDAGPAVIHALPNTPDVHNVIVCTLCSCYPTGLLGVSPDWYRSREYRSRVVRDPRAVLAEFGTDIPDDVELRVHDSSADLRYFVLPQRPEGTEDWDEERLAALITRDVLIGTTLPHP